MDLASKKNAADVPPPPEGDAERQSSNNDTSCDIIPGRDVNMVAGEAFQGQLEQPQSEAWEQFLLEAAQARYGDTLVALAGSAVAE